MSYFVHSRNCIFFLAFPVVISAHKLFLSYFSNIAVHYHCVKSVQIRIFFWSVFSRIWTEYGKIRIRKSSVFEHFSRSVCFYKCTAQTHQGSSISNGNFSYVPSTLCLKETLVKPKYRF